VKSIFASIPAPEANTWQLGIFQIRFYALFIIVGIILAVAVSALRLAKRKGNSGLSIDIGLWAIVLGILGARLFHVVTHINDYFGDGKDPLSALYIWQGGLAIYGGLLFGALGAYIGCRIAGVKFFAYADALVPGLLLAQAVGRWGNYFNNELFGIPTDLPWGLEISVGNPAKPVGLPDSLTYHPTFLYESIWSLLGIAVLLWAEKRFNLQWGRMFATYLMFYSFGRVFIESIRLDPSFVFLGVRTNVWSAVVGFAVGLVIFVVQGQKNTGIENTIYLPGREPKATGEHEVADEATDEADYELATDALESKSE
jgi:prolipoprotein diacylglyceryl transferase